MVEYAVANSLIGHGVGNIVYRLAKAENLSIREAGLRLSQGEDWDKAAALFQGGEGNV